MRIEILAAAFLATCTALPGQGTAWRDLTGEPAPGLRAESWLNTGQQKPSLDMLRGKVWLLEFFATT